MTDIPDEQSSAWADAADEGEQAVKRFMAAGVLRPLLAKGDVLAIQAACIGGIIGICGMMRDMLLPEHRETLERLIVSSCWSVIRGEVEQDPVMSDSPKVKFFGFVSTGDVSEPTDQEGLSRSAAMFEPIVRQVAMLPRDAQPAALGSCVLSFCATHDDPGRALRTLFQYLEERLPILMAQMAETRQ